jgi:SWI/SNF-related matrix-associated actin-dependent regulator of chromatin subfamily A member 5
MSSNNRLAEMGLGKTLQSISILVYMMEYKNSNGPHLIVVPKSTLSNWMNEIARWAPSINAVKFHGDKATRDDIVSSILEPGKRDEDRDWHVVVTTYEVCNIEKNILNKFAWTYLIIDEAHRYVPSYAQAEYIVLQVVVLTPCLCCLA